MKEMQQVREKILKSSLQSDSLLSSFPLRNGQNWTDGIASESQLQAIIEEDVTRIYRQLRTLKIAEWNQENENEEDLHWSILPMKQLGYRLDVSFMALVSRCLLPQSGMGLGTPMSNVCGMIADDYNDRILNQEILNQEFVFEKKMVTAPADVSADMNAMGGVKHVMKRMKQFRVKVLNSTLTYYDLRGAAEQHYQELKNLRKQQWKVENEATVSPWWSLSLRLPIGDKPYKPYPTTLTFQQTIETNIYT